MSTPYLGSKISLISRLDIRYEGILYTVDSNESTIALAKVRSFGTENRPTQHPVKPRNEVYEYIIFKASDIKDLVVCEGPKETEAEPGDVDYDPAIVSVSKPPAQSSVAAKPTQAVSQPRQNAPVYKQNQAQNQQHQSSQPPQYHQKPQNWQSNRPQQNRQNQQGRPFNSQQSGYNNQRQTNARPPFNRATAPKEKLKFDNDYNFEEANQEFQDKLDVVTDELDKVAFEADEKSSDNENEDKEGGDSCYDKKSSFFDSISCEAIEKAEGKNSRPDWRKERQTNTETFGQNAVRSHAYFYRNRFNNQNRFQGNRPQGGDQRFHQRSNQNNNGGISGGFKPRYNNRDQQNPRQNRAF